MAVIPGLSCLSGYLFALHMAITVLLSCELSQTIAASFSPFCYTCPSAYLESPSIRFLPSPWMASRSYRKRIPCQDCHWTHNTATQIWYSPLRLVEQPRFPFEFPPCWNTSACRPKLVRRLRLLSPLLLLLDSRLPGLRLLAGLCSPRYPMIRRRPGLIPPRIKSTAASNGITFFIFFLLLLFLSLLSL